MCKLKLLSCCFYFVYSIKSIIIIVINKLIIITTTTPYMTLRDFYEFLYKNKQKIICSASEDLY